MAAAAFLLLAMAAPYRIEVTPDGPALTEVLQTARAERRGRPLQIVFQPGTYFIRDSIRLGPADSDIQFLAQGRGPVRLAGSVSVTQWRPVTDPAVRTRLPQEARTAVRVADLTVLGIRPGELKRRGFGLPQQPAHLELFDRDRPMQVSRWPNEGWLRIADVPAPNTVKVAEDRPLAWKSFDDVWAMGYWMFDWAESYEPVANWNPADRTFGVQSVYGVGKGRRFYFLNVLEELDRPGEFYVDRTAGLIYYWPVAGTPRTRVSVLEGPILRLEGAKNVTLRGLVFEQGRGSGIVGESGENVRIERCLFWNLGNDGIALRQAKDLSIDGCDFTELGDGAIALAGGNRNTLESGNLLVQDCGFWRYSRWCRTYKAAINVEGVGTTVRNCTITEAPHNAILWGGNDHLFERNDVSRVCLETGDAGAFYAGRNPTMRGTVIRQNYFHDIAPKVNTEGNFTEVMSVYLDDCFCGTTIEQNLFDVRGTGIMLGGGQDNTIRDNLFVNNHPAVHFDQRAKGWASPNFDTPGDWGMVEKWEAMKPQQPPYALRYPSLASWRGRDPKAATGNVITGNFVVGGTWLRLLDGLTEKDFVNKDNVFVNENLDLGQALARAPATIRRIPRTSIGVTTKTGRPYDAVATGQW